MGAEDRVALILGRAIMRAEALQAQLEAAQARIAELEAAAAPEEPEASSQLYT